MSAAEEQECEDDGDRRKGSRSHSGKTPGFSVQHISDFEKFTEGMDDLGSSDEEDEEEESGVEEGDGEDDLEGASEEDGAEGRNREDDDVMTFSSVRVSEEVEKGRAVKNQIGLYNMVYCLLIFQSVCISCPFCLFVLGCSLSPVSFQLVCDMPHLPRSLKPRSSMLSQPFLH